jgi:hypothetical protein
MLSAVLAVALLVTAPAMSYADISIPKTAIDDILSYQGSLQLTEAQVSKLNEFNTEIIEEMIQVKARAEIRRGEVEKFSSDWSTVHGTATDQLIKEYYDLLADLKQLELEAIMKARGILTIQQMRQYANLANIEAMRMKLDKDYFAAY